MLRPQGDDWMLLACCCCRCCCYGSTVDLTFLRPLDNKVDPLLKELSSLSWLNRQYFTQSRLRGRSAALACLSPERFFRMSVDGLVGVGAEKKKNGLRIHMYVGGSRLQLLQIYSQRETGTLKC